MQRQEKEDNDNRHNRQGRPAGPGAGLMRLMQVSDACAAAIAMRCDLRYIYTYIDTYICMGVDLQPSARRYDPVSLSAPFRGMSQAPPDLFHDQPCIPRYLTHLAVPLQMYRLSHSLINVEKRREFARHGKHARLPCGRRPSAHHPHQRNMEVPPSFSAPFLPGRLRTHSIQAPLFRWCFSSETWTSWNRDPDPRGAK